MTPAKFQKDKLLSSTIIIIYYHETFPALQALVHGGACSDMKMMLIYALFVFKYFCHRALGGCWLRSDGNLQVRHGPYWRHEYQRIHRQMGG